MLGDAQRTGPRTIAPPTGNSTLKCVQLMSAQTALERAASVCAVPHSRPGDTCGDRAGRDGSDRQQCELVEPER